MSEADFLDRVEAWALGGLSELEEAEMQRHLDHAGSLRCVEAYRRAFAAAAALAIALTPSSPSPDTCDRIVARLGEHHDKGRAR